MNLVTLAQVKRYCGIPATYTDDDALLTRLIIDGEQWAEGAAKRSYKPVIETRLFDWPGQSIMYFDDDLLELITVTNGDALSTAISLSDLYTQPRRGYPKYGVGIKTSANVYWEFQNTPTNAISIKAAWGFHDDWGNAWLDSLDKVGDAGGINASVTTITVSNVDGSSINGDTPRFSAGMLIKIESEWLEVTAATNSTTDTLTVIRGARGSTAATHALNTAIYVFQPHRAITGAICAYVHWRYNQKNSRKDSTNEIPKDVAALVPSPMGAYFGS